MTKEESLLNEVERYSMDILQNKLPKGLEYHNVDHTLQVVTAVKEIASNSELKPEEIETLLIAAWFHDLGYSVIYDGHEEEGKKIAEAFLEERSVDQVRIQQIKELIGATKLGYIPQNTLESVIKDADMYNLSTREAYTNSHKIRHEWEVFRNQFLKDEEWEKENLAFFEDHEYYTPYCLEVLAPKKKRNIKKMRKVLRKLYNGAVVPLKSNVQTLIESQVRIEKLEKKLKKAKEQKPDRGIETMFRATYRVHISLSAIADNKANILLSVNAILLSVIATNLFDQIDGRPHLYLPAAFLILTCLSTIVYAILSTRPKVNSGVFTEDDILNKKTNLLFFGNFHAMDLGVYQWGIGEMMKDSDYLYGSMAKDIYFLGKVLAKKFRLLRIAYNIFMYGLSVSIISFAAAYMLYSA